MPIPARRMFAEELEPRDLPAVAFDTLPILPVSDPAVIDTARAIVARGRDLGRRTDAFMKVGDSNSDLAFGFGAGYLFPFGSATFNPVLSGLTTYYPELLDTLNAYRTPAGVTGTNSFSRLSPVAVAGARTGGVLPGLDAEANATGAGVALIMIGTNDVTAGTGPEAFREELLSLVRTLAADGVVPVLSTIPDNVAFGGTYAALVPAYNQVIADVAASTHVPLWNAWRALQSAPGHGLDSIGLHLNSSPNAGGLTPADQMFGQNVRDLGALQVLDWFRKQVVAAAPAPVPMLPWTPLAGQSVYAVGAGGGEYPTVSVYNSSGTEVDRFLAFDPGFTGGVHVATADVTGDGIPDVVVGAGGGGGPVVKVFSGASGTLVNSFFAFEPSFRTGVTVAAADLDGDGKAEVIVGAGDGGGPAVAVFRGGDLAEVQRFFAFEPDFRGGVNVAAGNLPGFGPSIVAGAGDGGAPVVKVFPFGSTVPAASFFVYSPNDRTGVGIAVADLDADGVGELVTAPANGPPHVRVLDANTGAELRSFFAGPTDGLTGVRLGVLRGGSGQPDTLLVGNGPGSPVSVQGFHGLALTPDPLHPADPARAFGVFVG